MPSAAPWTRRGNVTAPRRITAGLAACLAFCLPTAAEAARHGPPPSAKGLWEAYPLQPNGGAGPSGVSSGQRPQRRPPRSHPSARSGTGDRTVLAVATLGVAGAAGGIALLLVRRRSRKPFEAGPEIPPPASLINGPPLASTNGVTTMTTPSAPSLRPPDAHRPWTALIVWRAAEDQGRFQVVARSGKRGNVTTICQSPLLSWPPTDSSAVDEMSQAVDRIERAMVAAGWAATKPGKTWYAKRFAWTPAEAAAVPAPAEPAPAAAAPAEPAPAAPPTRPAKQADTVWRCEIAWDAGYVTSRFHALAFPPGSKQGERIGSSAPLRWMFKDDPDRTSPAHTAAVRSLEVALTAAGWQRAGRGPAWYSKRFVWRQADPPPRRIEPFPMHEQGEAVPEDDRVSTS